MTRYVQKAKPVGVQPKVLIEQRNLSVNRQGVISKQCKLCGKDL